MEPDKIALFIPFESDEDEVYTEPEEDPILTFIRDKPWYQEASFQSDLPFVCLHNEIIDFCDYILNSKNQREKRELTFKWASDTIKSHFSNADVQMFGSTATGLCLPNSDIDIVVFIESDTNISIMRAIKKAFDLQKTKVKSTDLITNTKVPLVKVVESTFNISIDISINSEDGMKAVPIIKSIIQLYPHFKYLVLVMKAFLKIRRLNETYYGGIGSFLLQLMVLAYLQYYYKEREYYIGGESLTEYLIGFLEFYSTKFNYAKLTIVVEGYGGFIDKELVKSHGAFSLLNPLNPLIDLGKSVYNAEAIFKLFKECENSLLSISDRTYTPLQIFLGKDYII